MRKNSATGSSKSQSFPVTVDLIENYAIFSLDMQGNITSWNKGAENITGLKKNEVLGKYYDFLYPDIDRVAARPTENLDLARKNGEHEDIGLLKCKDGKLILADVTISQILEETTGKQLGFIIVTRDLTSQRRLEDAQTDANKLLRLEVERRKKIEMALMVSNEELDAFASAASHDLQEPLRMVISYLQLIERRYANLFDQDGKEFLAFAVDGATRMKTLISDLVEYSRIDTLGKHLTLTNAQEALNRASDNLSVIISESKATITADPLPTITSEEVQLTRVFQNLIANAIKFRSPEPPHIHIGVSDALNEWEFQVSDNGKGIDEKNLSRIFLIFKQLGPKSERQGSGVGLAIVKKIISKHGGRVWATSIVGEGTTIHFTIPKQMGKEEKNG